MISRQLTCCLRSNPQHLCAARLIAMLMNQYGSWVRLLSTDRLRGLGRKIITRLLIVSKLARAPESVRGWPTMSSNQSTSLLQSPGSSCSVDRKLSQQASNRQLTNTFVTFLHLFRKTSINHSIKCLTQFLGGMNPLTHLARLQSCF